MSQTVKKRPVMLMILDGFGNNPQEEGNAVFHAKKPNFDALLKKYPNSVLKTSGLDVGLPDGQMGNSEVGHTNIGAGRVVYQELTRISKSISDGDFFENPALIKAMVKAKEKQTKLHVMGLLSDGGVHSHLQHLFAILKLAKAQNVNEVYIHPFFDGRDVAPDSGISYLEALLEGIQSIGIGKIATLTGRFYVMDRDNRWERVKLAYDALVNGVGEESISPIQTIRERYENKEYDEFIKPTVMMENGRPVATISDQDSVIFFNFRPDRAREITRSLVDEAFEGFIRVKGALNLTYVCMTQYDKTMPGVEVAFKPQSLKNTVGEYVSYQGLKQFRIAETEKYAHVTFFLNGGVEAPYEGEDRCLVPSPKVETYDLQPEMSAYEVTNQVLQRIEADQHDVYILNFANPDMVGHTGSFPAAVKAVEAVDVCLGRVVDGILNKNGVVIVTADHGNAEKMIDDETKKPHTAHTVFEVPVILAGLSNVGLRKGRLADLAPTMLHILGLEQPQEMTGESIIL